MTKAAFLALALAACSPALQAANADVDVTALQAGDAPCHGLTALDLGCAARGVDVNNAGALSIAEPSTGFAAATFGAGWGSAARSHAPVADFKDAAVGPALLLTAPAHHDTSRRWLPALVALGAMVVLLRRRPAGF